MNTSATGGYLVPNQAALDGDPLDDALQSLMVGITGLSPDLVRPRWQPIPAQQPAAIVNWAAIGVMTETPDDNAWIGHAPAGDGFDQMQRHVALDVLASFYGPGARSLASQVRDGLAVAQNREAVETVGMSFVASGPTRNVPELVGEQWVQRCDLPLEFRRIISRTYPIDNILQAPSALNNG